MLKIQLRFRALNMGTHVSNFARIRMVEIPEYLLRQTLIRYHQAQDEKTKLKSLEAEKEKDQSKEQYL